MLSDQGLAKLVQAIDAVESWRAAEEASIRYSADYLRSIDIGTRPAAQDVVETAVTDAEALVAELLGG
jgi:hypothetical protein